MPFTCSAMNCACSLRTLAATRFVAADSALIWRAIARAVAPVRGGLFLPGPVLAGFGFIVFGIIAPPRRYSTTTGKTRNWGAAPGWAEGILAIAGVAQASTWRSGSR